MKKPESKITPKDKSTLDKSQKIISGKKSDLAASRGKVMPDQVGYSKPKILKPKGSGSIHYQLNLNPFLLPFFFPNGRIASYFHASPGPANLSLILQEIAEVNHYFVAINIIEYTISLFYISSISEFS